MRSLALFVHYLLCRLPVVDRPAAILPLFSLSLLAKESSAIHTLTYFLFSARLVLLCLFPAQSHRQLPRLLQAPDLPVIRRRRRRPLQAILPPILRPLNRPRQLPPVQQVRRAQLPLPHPSSHP